MVVGILQRRVPGLEDHLVPARSKDRRHRRLADVAAFPFAKPGNDFLEGFQGIDLHQMEERLARVQEDRSILDSVLGLGGSKENLFELMHSGYGDLRDVPEDRLTTDTQRLIWRQSRAEQTHVGEELRQLARALPFPRYYLDFETMGPAVPIFAGTRPFEALPFQWSCHIETKRGAVEHAEFLDLGAAPPMRALAERLLAVLGTTGPIVVYTQFERRVISELAARYPDLAARLHAAAERIVDLHPATRTHYYHPAMLGSWSIKAVLPTVAPDLRYDTLGDVRDGLGAQTAYFEAIDPKTPPARRSALEAALRAYCRQDTLALVRLVEFFSRD